MKTAHIARAGSFSEKLHRSRARVCLLAAVFLAGFLRIPEAAAEPDAERINRVKAAFVLNITRFVSWPPEALDNRSDQLLLCLYRSNPFGQAIETIKEEPVAGRRLRTTHIQNLAESAPCHILLIADSELKGYAEDVQPEVLRPLLIIADQTDTDSPREPLRDVMVTLVRNGSRIGFEINLDKTRQAGLKMSSKLLQLATIVDDN